MKHNFILSNRNLFIESRFFLWNRNLLNLINFINLFYEIKICLFNRNLLFSIEVYLWNLCLNYWTDVNFSNLNLFFKSKFNFSESKFIFHIQIRLFKWKFVLSNQSLTYPSVTKKKIIIKVCSVFVVESNWQLSGLFVLVAQHNKGLHQFEITYSLKGKLLVITFIVVMIIKLSCVSWKLTVTFHSVKEH